MSKVAQIKKFRPKNWYSNRYQRVVIERNLLLIFALISLVSVSVSIIYVKQIMSSKSLEPYVIEIEDKTGVATVVQQLDTEYFTATESVRKYFINKFIHAMTGYNPANYDYDRNVVRLFSANKIYRQFRSIINPNRLGADSRINVRIKSMQFKGNSVQVRIARKTTKPSGKTTVSHEIIDLVFLFDPRIKLTAEERLINPLGFQITQFTISEEIFNY